MDREIIQNDLKKILRPYIRPEISREVYEYALFPCGKLFRSQLIYSLAQDLCGQVTPSHQFLAAAVECHHLYTLIHDDLPCMDDDDYRRGKESVHKKFGQWKAVLAADGLLNLSYGLLARTRKIELVTWSEKLLGISGLIQGQFFDLTPSTSFGVVELIQTHKLKTSRLFQFSLLSATFLAERSDLTFKMYRLGHHLGLLFQLMDDHDDIKNSDDCKREQNSNLFFKNPQLGHQLLTRSKQKIYSVFQGKSELRKLKQTIESYIDL